MFSMLATQLWKPVAIGLLIAAALGYRALLVHQRNTARAEVTRLSASLADAEASNAALQGAIATQNSAVAQLRTQLEQDAQAAAARERAATAKGAAAMRAAASGAQALERARIDTGCAAAIRWGNAQAAELSRW
ncbi:MAG TPA: hypothetical protein VNE82_15910 [Candidatus Binataceae bacterium]|nr:hypothetical protein [Candidatus Binataceae bacterium]